MLSIIGSGKVGSAIAFLAASSGMDDIVLVNRTKTKAIGEAMDLSNTIPESSSILISGTDDFSEIKDSKIVVITASSGVYTLNRLELISEQIKLVKDIAKKVKNHSPGSVVLMVSNPLDVLTYVFHKESNFPRERVIGVASSLDSSRFRYLLAKELETKQSEIKNALVLGEHGDSMVPIFSLAKKNQIPILDILTKNQIENITNNLKNYWKTLREFKSRSVFGISKNTYDVINSILTKQNISIPSSVLMNGEYGITDVCLGVPTKIGKEGIQEILEIELEKSELESLQKSAEIIKNQIHS